METYHAQASAVIAAPASAIYAVIADYRTQHPAILPTRYFRHVEVLKGGQGAGTVVAVDMEAYGAKTQYRLTVTEPEPGRVLQEEDTRAGVVTTFTLDPLADAETRVTIATAVRAGTGMKGWFERMVTPVVMRRIYREELAQLDALMARQTRDQA